MKKLDYHEETADSSGHGGGKEEDTKIAKKIARFIFVYSTVSPISI